MTTTIAQEDREEFVALFDRGREYFNTYIAGDPRESSRSLEWDASFYYEMHDNLADIIHSDAPITAASFVAEGIEQLEVLIRLGVEDYDYAVGGTDPATAAKHAALHAQAEQLSFGH